ncbi:5'-nucleotidase C-terminal domain-containing protein [Psychrobacillus sp. BL-248-WT-3]|uniref:5'-nucleotidase C-terminal domain-containing protein n=1 Tax=Psychrobacillus sp. BL-248-WT-3 TaxID=2725306 RepID=UPI00146EDF65|nr:5'-nucleotidase C-terminal domain-containing protein [Psychrobacillus sp. BL-248-WT-3]NME07616.1 bifunctional metallophosphatase/5'-nucleotidase [Psychrobacillus sp. BL-248-WT-3]
MNNKMKKSVMAAVLTTSLLVSSNTGYANSSLQSMVDQARKDMKEAAYAYVVPAQNGQVATSAELYPALNLAKKNYQKVRSAIQKSNASNKNAMLRDLDALYEERVTKGIIPYIDAYNYADKYLNPIMADMKKAESAKDWEKVESLYHKLSVQLKNRTVILYRFSGKAARDLLLDQYKEPANQKRDQLMIPVTIYMKVKEADKLLAAGKKEEAIKILESIKPLVIRLPSPSALPMVKELIDKVTEVSKKAGMDIIIPTPMPTPVPTPPSIPNPPPSPGNGGGGGGGGGTPDTNFKLSIMHTNDTHAQLDNVAKRVTAVKDFRKEKPSALLIDAGDVFSGTLYFNEFQGQADLEFMNLMKYDVMTLGNHEFDLGSSSEGHKALAEFIKKSKFPIVSSNVDFSEDVNLQGLFNVKVTSSAKDGQIYSGIIKVVNGQKIGLFGLTTQETKDISSPEKVAFTDYIKAAETMVAEFKKQGVNKVIAVTHLGYDDNPAYDNDLELAARVSGIDIIVGGHSHTKLEAPVVVNKDKNGKAKDPTVIVQAYQYSEFLGTLDVEFDKNGKVVKNAGKLISVNEKTEDAEAKKMLEKYSNKIKEIKEMETGATAVKALENPRATADNPASVRSNETPLGNLITDGMLNKARVYNKDVIMAFQNGGGIRAAINQGPITVGEVISVLPFGNTLATMKLSGAEIKAAFEISFKESPKENGGFLHVSGAKVVYDSTKPVGQRVVSIQYKDAAGKYVPLENEQEYMIATNAFTAKGGDGYDVLKKAYEQGRVTDLGLSDWENLREHIAALKTVDPQVEGRIVNVAGQGDTEIPGGNIPADDFSGTKEEPKVYKGDVTVSLSDISKLEHAVIKGNLTLVGSPSGSVSFFNITVEGDADFSELDSDSYTLDGITVLGNIIL